MDEIDAIGGRRFSEGTSADREIQRTLMELLNQLDGFDQLGKVLVLSCSISFGDWHLVREHTNLTQFCLHCYHILLVTKLELLI